MRAELMVRSRGTAHPAQWLRLLLVGTASCFQIPSSPPTTHRFLSTSSPATPHHILSRPTPHLLLSSSPASPQHLLSSSPATPRHRCAIRMEGSQGAHAARARAAARLAWAKRQEARPSAHCLGRAALVYVDTAAALRELASGSRELTVVKCMRSRCRACNAIADQFEKLAGSYLQLTFVEFRLERDEKGVHACREFGVTQLPTLQVFRGDTCLSTASAVTRSSFHDFEASLHMLAQGQRGSHKAVANRSSSDAADEAEPTPPP